CALDDRVGIVYFQVDTDAGAAQRLRHFAVPAFCLRELIAEKKFVALENNLAMQESLAVGSHHTVAFFSAEHFFVELKRSRSITDDQVGNELIISGHHFLLNRGFSILAQSHRSPPYPQDSGWEQRFCLSDKCHRKRLRKIGPASRPQWSYRCPLSKPRSIGLPAAARCLPAMQ